MLTNRPPANLAQTLIGYVGLFVTAYAYHAPSARQSSPNLSLFWFFANSKLDNTLAVI